MSTINLATLQSNTALPPTIQNSSAVEIGTFCRAWVNFNGTGTVAIRASFNVSSITDNGTGSYTVNFTTAMSDANYSAIATCSTDATTIRTAQTWTAATMTTTACQIAVTTTNTTAASDAAVVTFAVFR
jgi:hypothetical protein